MGNNADFSFVISVLIGHFEECNTHLLNYSQLNNLLVARIHVLSDIRRRHVKHISFGVAVLDSALEHALSLARIINGRFPVNEGSLKYVVYLLEAALDDTGERLSEVLLILVLGLCVAADPMHHDQQVGFFLIVILNYVESVVDGGVRQG